VSACVRSVDRSVAVFGTKIAIRATETGVWVPVMVETRRLSYVLGDAGPAMAGRKSPGDDGKFVALNSRERLAVIEHADNQLRDDHAAFRRRRRVRTGRLTSLNRSRSRTHDGERPHHCQRRFDIGSKLLLKALRWPPGERVVKGKESGYAGTHDCAMEVTDLNGTGGCRRSRRVEGKSSTGVRLPSARAGRPRWGGLEPLHKQLQARLFIGKASLELGASWRRRHRREHELSLTVTSFAVARQEPLDRALASAPHAVVLEPSRRRRYAHLDAGACRPEERS